MRYRYFSSRISIKKLTAAGEFCGKKTTKTFRITSKNAGFRSVTGQQFYVETMLNLATRGPACVCSTGVLRG